MHIGIAGTGNMGSAIARRLLAAGHDVTVWNRTAARVQPLLEAGACAAGSPAVLAAGPDLVISVLADQALEEVYFGEDGLLSGDPGGRLFIDMSPAAAATQRRMGERVTAAGGRYLECAPLGDAAAATQGGLVGLAGGDAWDVESARALLDQLCRRLEHVGGCGAGAAAVRAGMRAGEPALGTPASIR
ncbi:MAG TPA: NAD(P)-binding domain-containing protein [Ramlibacter sp.]|jgi:3-hydroxyisobutyrate dehydrogenase|uniref:NAD(P)-dependent oxidoreductase n=1 Tax=Ramlibacter sp. TaxID=1917967 RepID=UPI002D6E57F3|nr:NAD(P)-binding domain-containing protein [Ramlibacter sp.]HZY19012.1 NAD(P)-binding domain-containing protein [Ramlibacter sp.]